MANKKKETFYIVSRASQDTAYTGWTKNKNGINKREMTVLIRGGAHVVDKRTLTVPNGVVTPVSAEELEFLKTNSAFKRHLERGFLSIETGKDKAEEEAEKESTDSEGNVIKDKSAQLTEKDFEDENSPTPNLN